MSDLIKLLKRFNRKERFFLIRQALDLTQNEFRLSEEFRKKLGCKLEIEIRFDASVWMDYHLDAVAGSLWCFRNSDRERGNSFPMRDGKVTGTQQDIDFLIAFREEGRGVYHLVFLEAKGYDSKGFASWDTSKVRKQMKKKARQLKCIFDGDRKEIPKVKTYFCLLSKHEPEMLTTKDWPAWMREGDNDQPHWLELYLPSDRRRVTRYDPDKGKPSKEGNHFVIVEA